MAQGWNINPTTDVITFLEPPATGVNNIVVTEYAASAVGGTDSFALGSWNGDYGYPTEVEFFSDRLWWAGSLKDKQNIWGSQVGDYTNYGKSTPIIDSDAVSFAINTRQVNAVMDLVPLDKMIILAKGGEFIMTGGQDEVITPSTIGVKPQSFLGTGGVQAKVVGDTAVLVQEQGQRVCDIGYRFEQDGYRPQDICVWAEHLVESNTLLFMEWMPAPWSCLWFVRDDGKQLGCTYMPAQEVIGWHQHDTGRDLAGDGDDDIIDMVCLPGTKQTEVHALVRRTIDGVTQVYLEQMAENFVDDIRDWCYLDSALTYDGRNTGATTVTLSGGTLWTETETLTLTVSVATFVGAGDVGDGFLISRVVNETDASTGVTTAVTYSVRVVITEYTSSTVVSVASVGTVPAQLRALALTTWVLQRNTMSGLSHLEGMQVGILADASVVTNGRPGSGTAYVVTGGAVTLPYPAGVVQIGLPYRAHLESLEFNAPGGDSMLGKKKLIESLAMRVKDTRGIKACAGILREAYLDNLPQREFENYGDPTLPLTGYGKVTLSSEWGDQNGKVHIVSDDPLPAEILALQPKLMASD